MYELERTIFLVLKRDVACQGQAGTGMVNFMSTSLDYSSAQILSSTLLLGVSARGSPDEVSI